MKQKLYLTVTILFLISVQLKAQAPNAFNYQGVARNSSGGILPNQAIGLQFTIHQGSSGGTTIYQETQTDTTNQFGLFTVAIGNGTVKTGTIAGVGWGSNTEYLQVQMDPNGGTNYLDMGTQQFLSVPYALYAANSGGGSGGITTVTGTPPIFVTNGNSAPDISILGTSGGVLYGTGTGAAFTAGGASGQILQSNGAGVAPTWVTLSASGVAGWNLTGNSGTIAGTNFVGTTDATDLVLKANGTPCVWISNQTTFVGLGTVNPAQKLDVVGNVKFSGALMPDGEAGTAGNILISGGASLPPTWLANGTKGQILTANNNGVPIWATSSGSSGWSLTGNAGTTAGTNFIGTTDNTDFVAKTNNIERVRITKSGNVGVGTSTPAADAGVAIKGLHLEAQAGSTAPTISVNPINIGIGGTVMFGATNGATGGTDVGGSLMITTGGAATNAGQILTVNFGAAYTTAPAVVISPTDATTAASDVLPYVTSTTTGFSVNFANVAALSTTYNFNYFVIETQ